MAGRSPRLATIALAVLLAACASAGTTGPTLTGAHRVLFIGNSLTFWNDLPGLVQVLAESAGVDSLVTDAVALPAFSLEDHWNDGRAATRITAGWDVVVLQQGPSALEASRVLLLEYSARFATLIRQAHGEPALYMVWPMKERFTDFDRVRESYRLAAEHVGGAFFPSGEGWRSAWRGDSTLALYGPDDFHPSPLGTYVAALVIVQRLTGHSPVGLPTSVVTPGGTRFDIDPTLGRALQAAAHDANARF